ncbi:hypothetical protein [Bordetella genomosp. 9]|uniref:hypothetical protein n=1 Tax=Bordetella genomosp. 9 TaxID=1416803 RepID=UPI0012FC59D9|nr:hypothetical protein [Bordetella genomosp. 9]
MDNLLASEYRKAAQRLGDSAELAASERTWLRTVRDRCTDVSCLIRAYDDRISVLQAMKATPPNPTSPSRVAGSTIQMRPLPPAPTAPPEPTSTSMQNSPPVSAAQDLSAQAANDLSPAAPQKRIAQIESTRAVRTAPNSATGSTTPANAPSETSGAGLAFISTILIFMASALTPKRDRRFKTGYKDNKTVPKIVPALYAIAGVLFVAAFVR